MAGAGGGTITLLELRTLYGITMKYSDLNRGGWNEDCIFKMGGLIYVVAKFGLGGNV
jgi:hypothetical protein